MPPSEPQENSDLIQWHTASVSAVKLELEEYKDVLEFVTEFPLSKKPMQIDIIVIKKLKEVTIEKNLARIFRGHNIFEYFPVPVKGIGRENIPCPQGQARRGLFPATLRQVWKK